MHTHTRFSKTLKRAAVGALIALLLIGALALDLANHGAAWTLFFRLTGEESMVAQIRGMIELGSNLTRPPLDLALDQPVRYANLSPYGINTFLEQEVEIAKREQSLRMIADAGFTWIRQQFSWEDIEVHGRGDFSDRRNEAITGVVNAWDKYDNIVDLADQYGLAIMARLDNPPAWTHANPEIGSFAPPDDVQDFVNFAVTLAERYRGRIHYYQVWNEPNIYPEWGNQSVNPEAYTELLCRTYHALKAVDPDIVVITGALAPTLELTGRDLNDLIFLQRMYDAGAGECFDVLSAQAYGFFSAPTDLRTRPTTITFTRHRYLRDLMVANGDTDTPIWLSEAAWNPIDSPEVPPDVQSREAYGVVTAEQAARYMPMGYELAEQDYPYLGVMFYWFFKRAGESERNQSWYYFRMVEPDFTPRPVYDAMRDYITTQTPILYRGMHEPYGWGTQHDTGVERINVPDSPYGYAMGLQQGYASHFRVHGTEAIFRMRAAFGTASVIVSVGNDEHRLTVSDQPADYTIPLGMSAATAEISIRVMQDGNPLYVESVQVNDHTLKNVLPVFAVAVVPVGILLVISAYVWLEHRRKA